MTSEIRWNVTYPDTDNNNLLMELGAENLEHAQLLASRISQLHGSATIANNDTPPFSQAWLNGQIWMVKPLEFREEALKQHDMVLMPVEDGTSRTIPADDIRALLGYTSNLEHEAESTDS